MWVAKQFRSDSFVIVLEGMPHIFAQCLRERNLYRSNPECLVEVGVMLSSFEFNDPFSPALLISITYYKALSLKSV